MGRRYRLTVDLPLVREALEREGWRAATRAGGWDLCWTPRIPSMRGFKACREGRILNHFPAIEAIVRKDALSWTLEAARLDAPSVYHFAPRTFVMPEDRRAFLRAAASAPRALWISKPSADACGRGIHMVEDPRSEPATPDRLVQRYLSEPHLLDGFKYTLRCYVLVTSFDPLRVYMSTDGFAKLTSRPFTTARDRLKDRFVHLTNPDIQRLNREVATSSRNLTHAQYRARLRRMGVDDAALFRRIRRVVAATIFAARDVVLEHCASALPSRPGTMFELLGFDVLVDRRMKPWLVECNLNPSLVVEADATTPAAKAELLVKRRVVAGALELAGALERKVDHGFLPVLPAKDTSDLASRLT